MYGTQTISWNQMTVPLFENDVKMYGTQTPCHRIHDGEWFENDVKMYGTQTAPRIDSSSICLRMM